MPTETQKAPSPTRTYVIPIEIDSFKHFMFKKFILPDVYENSCSVATWYFYNHINSFDCGLSAFSFEDYSNIIEVS